MILVDPKVDPEADELQVSTLIDRPTGPPTPNERSRMICSLAAVERGGREDVVGRIRSMSVFGPRGWRGQVTQSTFGTRSTSMRVRSVLVSLPVRGGYTVVLRGAVPSRCERV